MGWCSATTIFDTIMDYILSGEIISKKEAFKVIIKVFQDMDWDCELESRYANDPDFITALKELCPNGFDWVI